MPTEATVAVGVLATEGCKAELSEMVHKFLDALVTMAKSQVPVQQPQPIVCGCCVL